MANASSFNKALYKECIQAWQNMNALILLLATLCKSYSAFITHAWLPNTIDFLNPFDGLMDMSQLPRLYIILYNMEYWNFRDRIKMIYIKLQLIIFYIVSTI